MLWSATVVANIGTWMYTAAAGWLMTRLDADPFVVSLVQVATTLPIFLLALPAGALSDIVDRRRMLIVVESATTAIAAIFAALVSLDRITPTSLLVLTFLLSAVGALSTPVWQSVVPQLVPRHDLSPAIAANSVGVNISRAVGPAAGGVITAAAGVAAPFWLNAISNLGIIGALLWWRPPTKVRSPLPAERFAGAIRTGIRHARNNRELLATMMRAVGFLLFASAYWALLPLVVRNQIHGGPELYGIVLGAIGVGAVIAAFALPGLKARLGPDRAVAVGTIGTAVALILFGLAHDLTIALVASLLAGMTWIAVLANLNVSAQVALPDWVRGRGLALFVTVFFGALTLGSAAWGQVAQSVGLPVTHFAAAAGALIAMVGTWRWKLQTGAGPDLASSTHWPAPVTSRERGNDEGPVFITVEYRIDPSERNAFLVALDRLAEARRRDGAYGWGIFEDTADEGKYVETFYADSWLEHLRQHERVTQAARIAQEVVGQFHRDGSPKVAHFVAPARSRY